MVAAAQPVVAVVGLRALRRDLNRMTADFNGPVYAAMKAAGRSVAEPIAAATRAALPHVSNTLADDVRVSVTRTGAGVRMGRKRVPYAGWVEFGGTRRQGPHDRSARPFIKTGRYMFPAAERLAPRAAADYQAALTRVLTSTQLWTNTTSDGRAVHD